MANYPRNLLDLKTRPRVAAPHSDYVSSPLPTFCVVYHSDAAVLGARCVLVPNQDLVLGRELEFTDRAGNPCYPLLDPYVSRELGRCMYSAEGFVMTRRPGASSIESRNRSLGAENRFELTEDHWYTLNCSNRLVLSLRLESPSTGDLAAMDSIVGSNPKIVAMRQTIRRVAATDDDVLITGPTGAGKEGVATELHRFSQRRSGPMVAVNMAALPSELAAAELFGAEKGAYTGANSSKPGYFRQASGGTLFMDEIGDAAPQLQSQLLRALQTREIQVLGGSTQTVDVRVVAATELQTNGQDASMRQALYHRLSQQQIEVPALNERLDDLGLLAHHYCQQTGLGPWSTDQDDTAVASWCQVFVALMAYDWPGNVRELFAVLGQVAVAEGYPRAPVLGLKRVQEDSGVQATAEPISDQAFLAALEACDYQVSKLAEHLGMSRQSIYRRRDKLGLPRAKDYTRAQVIAALDENNQDLSLAAKALRVSVAALLHLYPEFGV